MTSSSSTHTHTHTHTHTTGVYDNEPTDHVDNSADESTYIPFPPRLPPLTVPTYPSQVPAMSISLNTPHPSANTTNKPPSTTTTPHQVQHTYDVTQPRSVADCSRTSYGYNSNVSFPARPTNQGIGISSGPTNDRADNIHPEESLVSAVYNLRN